jgi:hypothetical protein
MAAVNSPSVMVPESFDRASGLSPWADFSAVLPEVSLQSGLVDAVHVPERLAGRLAPSVPMKPERLSRLSRIACGPVFDCECDPAPPA